MKLFSFLIVSVPSIIIGQNLCDDSYGLYCPEEAGWDVGNCLKKLPNQEVITNECLSFISLHDFCKVKLSLLYLLYLLFYLII